jgi:hypothetical protein
MPHSSRVPWCCLAARAAWPVSLALPRHNSYPLAPVWQSDYGPGNFRADRQRSAERGIEKRFGIAFDDYFGEEESRLRALSEQGLVILETDIIRLTAPLGRLLVRVVAAVFDRFLPRDAFRKGLSAHASKVG